MAPMDTIKTSDQSQNERGPLPPNPDHIPPRTLYLDHHLNPLHLVMSITTTTTGIIYRECASRHFSRGKDRAFYEKRAGPSRTKPTTTKSRGIVIWMLLEVLNVYF